MTDGVLRRCDTYFPRLCDTVAQHAAAIHLLPLPWLQEFWHSPPSPHPKSPISELPLQMLSRGTQPARSSVAPACEHRRVYRRVYRRRTGVLANDPQEAHLVTSWIAPATYATFFELSPAIEMRPSLVR